MILLEDLLYEEYENEGTDYETQVATSLIAAGMAPDTLEKAGGQCAELYPEKPIYDIPSWPVITGQELTDKLLQQIAPFAPTMALGQLVRILDLVGFAKPYEAAPR